MVDRALIHLCRYIALPGCFTDISDGVHMTTKGYTLLWDNISETIKTQFKGRGLDYDDFDDLPRRVPMWVRRSDHCLR